MKPLLLIPLFFLSIFSFSQSWQSVGGGTNNSSHGLINWNGQLINLGSFNNRVANWDGSNWNCLGGGVGIVARAATVWQGKLVVVGDFWNVQQPCVGCNGVAVWDGVSWTPLGTGVNNDVLTCTVWNNELVIAGDFTQAGGQPISRIAKWNGVSWEGIGAPSDFTNDIRAMVEFEGELWVGGDFNNVGGCTACDGLVKWDASTTTWVGGNSGVDLVGGVNESVRVLYVNPNDGNLYMGGEFPELWDGDAPAEDYNMGGIAMYDGSNWYPLGTGLNEYCRAIHEYNGDIVAGGYFTTAGGVSAKKIARWNGSTWSAMGQGFDGAGVDEYVKSATVWNGIFFAGGAYTQAEGGPMNYIAQWYEPPTAAPVAWINYSSATLCGSGCIDFLDNSTNNPTSWTWSFPGSDTPTSSAQYPGTVCYSSPGTYNVSLQACNGNGCNTQNMTITVENGATVTANDAAICGAGPATLTAVPSVGGGTFLWSPGGETTASITVNPGSTTNYTVTYSYLGCTSNAVSTVTVGSGPSVSVTGGNSICEGQSLTLTATPSAGGGTYLWSPGGETSQSITISPSSTTNYTVEYTLNGCTSTPVVEMVTVNPIPSVSVPDETICDGGSATLTATPSTGGGTYLWSPGGETTPSITQSPGTTTTYSVVYTLNGCASTSETATINVNSTPTLNVNNESICEGQSVTLVPVPSTGGGTYLWSPGGETTPTITVSPATNQSYDVSYTLNGCTSPTETINVNVTSTPTVSVANPAICQGQSATITATPSAGGGTYLWSPGGDTSPSITVSPASTTSYTVQYTLNGCVSPVETSTVTVNPTFTSTEGITVCEGEIINYPDGTSETAISNTSHLNNLTSDAGCDSLVTTNVTVNPTLTTIENQEVCYGANYTYPDGTTSTNVTINELHISNLAALSGCDSVVTTNLTVLSPYNESENIDICSGANYTYPDGTVSTNITVNESHISNLLSVLGCDSTVTTNLTIVSAYNEIENADICEGDSYTYPDGTVSSGIVTNESHISNLISTSGCDSIVTTYINVNPIPDNSVTAVNEVLTANQNGANYQWIDCDLTSPIVNETGQSYTAAVTGNYAVEITMNGCSSTSDCIYTVVGLEELIANSIQLFPNPVEDFIFVESANSLDGTRFEIIDAQGRIVQKGTLDSNELIDVRKLSPGTYSLRFKNSTGTAFVKI